MTVTRQHVLIALALIVGGLATYASVLGTFFVADDFAYLDAIKTSGSPSIVFSALAGRYFRPAVVFVYYINFLVSGLSPWTYHVSVVLIHVTNAWLVFLVGRRLFPGRDDVVPVLSAVLFLVFGGHAEAVTWIGGMADPLVTLFLLLGLVCFMHALDSARPAPLFICVWLAFAGALLSKESAAIFPALAIVALVLRPGWWERTQLRRTVMMLLPVIAISIAYIALRRHMLGFSFVTLEGLGTGTSFGSNVRAFFIRSFLPQGPLLLRICRNYLDVLVWLPVLLGFAVGVVRHKYRPLTFLTLCLALALAPVLPLSVGIVSTDSERFIYLPSAFACLLVVSLLDTVLRQRWLVVASTLCFCAWHLVALEGHNRTWRAAAEMTSSHTSAYGPLVRAHAKPGQPIFIVNLTDNVSSAFVWRRGFHEALRITTPDQAAAVARTFVVSVMNVTDWRTRADVLPQGPRAFDLRVTNGSIAGQQATPFFVPRGTSASGLTVDFTPLAGRALILYFTPHQMQVAGVLPMSLVPFGHIDGPADTLACGGPEPDLQGWALDDDGIARVVIAAERTDVPGEPIEIAEAQSGPRPDVMAALPYFPNAERAGWSLKVPCAKVRTSTAGAPTRLVVIAENRRGEKARLGTRAVTFAP